MSKFKTSFSNKDLYFFGIMSLLFVLVKLGIIPFSVFITGDENVYRFITLFIPLKNLHFGKLIFNKVIPITFYSLILCILLNYFLNMIFKSKHPFFWGILSTSLLFIGRFSALLGLGCADVFIISTLIQLIIVVVYSFDGFLTKRDYLIKPSILTIIPVAFPALVVAWIYFVASNLYFRSLILRGPFLFQMILYSFFSILMISLVAMRLTRLYAYNRILSYCIMLYRRGDVPIASLASKNMIGSYKYIKLKPGRASLRIILSNDELNKMNTQL